VHESMHEDAMMRTDMLSADGKATIHVKGETAIRTKIKKALRVARGSLAKAHGAKQKAAAKAAVKAALADAGVTDADAAGTIAWAGKNVVQAKTWAVGALKRDAQALGKVAAWTKGDRQAGLKARKKCERAVQAMIAVASKTKNSEMVAKEDELRQKGKMKSYDVQIKEARKAAQYAEKSVDHARAALAMTLGTKARIAARHALIRAKDAVHDANTILKMEVGKANVITSNRLQSDGARLVGESELHYRCRKMFHRANRVLKLVNTALTHARKNHYAHKEAVMKRTQKVTAEAAAKLAHKERRAKSEARRKKLGIATKEEYAAYLAKEALKYGNLAKDDAHKAAKAGKLAAEKALESSNVKAELGAKPTSTATVKEALQREEIAADLATKAAKMEDAIVTGGRVPKTVMALITDSSGKTDANALDAARAAALSANVAMKTQDDFHDFVAHKKQWKKHYDDLFKKKVAELKAAK